MLNQEGFVTRLNQIFDHYNLTAAMFADEIKVQRSSISHLLSGRNKPSLEFVLKIVERYKEVSFDWLLNGKGVFPQTRETKEQKKLFNSPPTASSIKKSDRLQESNITEDEIPTEQRSQSSLNTSIEVEKIVVFYKDGTFKEYLQKNN